MSWVNPYITALIRLFRTQAQDGLGKRYEKEKTVKGEKKDSLRKDNTSPSPYYNTIRDINLYAPASTLKRKIRKQKPQIASTIKAIQGHLPITIQFGEMNLCAPSSTLTCERKEQKRTPVMDPTFITW